jgi:nucleotide-binding universal stress UspA family protein
MSYPIFHRIVVPTDFSECAEGAWALARRMAAAFGSELVLVHVLVDAPLYAEGPFNTGHTRDVFAAARTWGERALTERVEAARAAGLHARSEVRTGRPHAEIVALATDARADLIVIGTHGREGLNRALLGSVADRVVHLAPCPVLTVRDPSGDR